MRVGELEKKNIGLSHYVRVEKDERRGKITSYGGSQSYFTENDRKSVTLRNFGCGLIGVVDLLLHVSGRDTDAIEINKYLRLTRNAEHFFHVRKGMGINGFMLAIFLQVYFWKNHMRYHVRWGVLPWNMKKKIKEMLRDDIPVIFSVGPGYFRKEKVTLYGHAFPGGTIDGPGLVAKTTAKDHYMTITGIYETKHHGTVLRISSWGNLFYIKWSEYIDYMRKYDNALFTNILYVKKY